MTDWNIGNVWYVYNGLFKRWPHLICAGGWLQRELICFISWLKRTFTWRVSLKKTTTFPQNISLAFLFKFSENVVGAFLILFHEAIITRFWVFHLPTCEENKIDRPTINAVCDRKTVNWQLRNCLKFRKWQPLLGLLWLPRIACSYQA